MANSHFSDLARLRQGAYRLLSAWHLYPESSIVAIAPEAARLLKTYDEITANLAFFNQWLLLLDTLENMAPSRLGELQESYMRLFGESGSNETIHLCETSYLRSPEAMAWVAANIVGQYQEGGVSLSAPQAPDHLAVELEFLSFLCDREARAWEEGKRDLVSEILEREKRFLIDHLYQWLPAFIEKISKRTEEGFYNLLSQTVWAIVTHDSDFVGALKESVQGS